MTGNEPIILVVAVAVLFLAGLAVTSVMEKRAGEIRAMQGDAAQAEATDIRYRDGLKESAQ